MNPIAGPKEYYSSETRKAGYLPLHLETLAGIDWLALRFSPVLYGIGIPKGDGSAVVVIPGFMASDLYLNEMIFWLRRMGYKAYKSNIGVNANCLDVLDARLMQTIEKAYAETGRKVHLIGHSLGGVLGRSAAGRRPELIASVTTLGSPFRGITSHPLVMRASEVLKERMGNKGSLKSAGCLTGGCTCPAVEAMKKKLGEKVPVTAIYTKSDGVVDWRYCVDIDPRNNFEVWGTHCGLAFNPSVYRLIAQRLAASRRVNRSTPKPGSLPLRKAA